MTCNTSKSTNQLYKRKKFAFALLGLGYSLKKLEKLTKINEVFEFTGKTEISLPLIANGKISIAAFLDKNNAKKTAFIKFIKPIGIQSFFRLPVLEDFDGMNIRKFTIKIHLVDRRGKRVSESQQEAVIADLNELVWRDKTKSEREILAFGIPDRLKDDKKLKYICDFSLSYKLGKKTKSLKFSKDYPAFNGEIPLNSIEDFIQIIKFDGKRLDFNGEGKLMSVLVNISCGKIKVSGTISSVGKKLTFFMPAMLDEKDKIIKGKLKFIAAKKKTIKFDNLIEERGNNIRLKNWEWRDD